MRGLTRRRRLRAHRRGPSPALQPVLCLWLCALAPRPLLDVLHRAWYPADLEASPALGPSDPLRSPRRWSSAISMLSGRVAADQGVCPLTSSRSSAWLLTALVTMRYPHWIRATGSQVPGLGKMNTGNPSALYEGADLQGGNGRSPARSTCVGRGGRSR